jgi:hypothetical protein
MSACKYSTKPMMARRKGMKKSRLLGVNEHFERVSNVARDGYSGILEVP